MEPTFENDKLKLQEHLRFLIDQPIRDFQERNKVNIEKVTVNLDDGAVKSVKINIKISWRKKQMGG